MKKRSSTRSLSLGMQLWAARAERDRLCAEVANAREQVAHVRELLASYLENARLLVLTNNRLSLELAELSRLLKIAPKCVPEALAEIERARKELMAGRMTPRRRQVVYDHLARLAAGLAPMVLR